MDQAIKVLYVEDDPASVTLVRRVLENEGYQIVAAPDGLSGIEAARQELPDLILMDIDVGGLDGYEVSTRLRSIEELKKVPIVAVTAARMRGDRERALIAGCTGYIPKPIDVDTFSEQVRSFLRGTKEDVESAEEKAGYLVEYSHRLVDRLEKKLRELEKAHADLQRLDKMKTDFIILSSHELRTPLTAIYGYAQILRSNPAIPGSADDAGSPRCIVERMAEATWRLNQVIGDILNVALLDARELDLATEPVFLDSLIHKAVRSISDSAPDRQLTFDLGGLDNLPRVTGDSKRLYQALWNVISNAVKYTPDGGRIRITGDQIEDTAHVAVQDNRGQDTGVPRIGEIHDGRGGGQEAGGRETADINPDRLPPTVRGRHRPRSTPAASVHVVVQDSGVGIPPEDQERIFDRFYVLENTDLHCSSKTAFKGGGLGVGLTVARGIIRAHGGRIWAESEGYDEERLPGSTFHILLPQRQEEAGGKRQEGSPDMLTDW